MAEIITTTEGGISMDIPAQQVERPSDEEMAKVYDEANSGDLPDNFKSVDDLVKSYKELQAQFTKQRQAEKQGNESNTEESVEQSEEKVNSNSNEGIKINLDSTESKEGSNDTPVNFAEIGQELFEKGELSQQTYNKFKRKGFDKATIDQMAQGYSQIIQNQQNSIYGLVGGKEEYKSMIEWAKSNLDRSDLIAYDRAMDAGTDVAKLAVKGLYSEYKNSGSGDSEPKLVKGLPAASSANQGFESNAQIVAAMSDPKYKSDPAFRKIVIAKLAKTNVTM